MLEWIGASVIAPRPHTPIEFEIASKPGIRTGYFREAMFYSAGDPAGYPRKLIRRWRYIDDGTARNDFACAINT
jgi:hypothetical protein